MSNTIHEAAKLVLEEVNKMSDEEVQAIYDTHKDGDMSRLFKFMNDELIPTYEQEAIPIKDHPLRDEIIEMSKKGELVIS